MTSRTLRVAAALAVTLAAPAFGAAAAAQITIGAPVDPGLGYVGPFGLAASGGTARFAQTFQRPGAGFNALQQFTVNLGDFNADGSGTALQFRAGVFAVTGTTLGAPLFQSAVRAGSGNYTGFDAFTFLTPGLVLDPGVSTFAFVLEALGGPAGALDVLAAAGADYAGGALFTVGGTGALVAVGGGQDAAFSATFGPAAVVPEPGTVALVGVGFVGLAGVARRRRS